MKFESLKCLISRIYNSTSECQNCHDNYNKTDQKFKYSSVGVILANFFFLCVTPEGSVAMSLLREGQSHGVSG